MVGDTYAFASHVCRLIGERLRTKSQDIRLLVEADTSFKEWLAWEAYLACKADEAAYPFCEVTAKPTYGSEKLLDADGKPDQTEGDLRVGGTYDADDHRWIFIEFVVLREGNCSAGVWRRAVEEAEVRLKRLGWKRSASVLIILANSRGDILSECSDNLASLTIWSQPTLGEHTFALPGGGLVVIKAFDVKQDPTHTLGTSVQ